MVEYPNVKINLGLKVLRRRSDGFHDIETLFVPCNGFHDTLEITRSEEFSIRIDGPCYGGWNPQEDLCAKAWRLLQREYGIGPVAIHLEKTSPVGAGLGGGSADAAFALKMLNEEFSLGLSLEKLASLAAELGSDCAFFIYNEPMFASGRGEVLEAFDIDLSPYEIRVEMPADSHVSTKEAYAGIVPSGESDLREVLALPVSEWKGRLVNDFEASVFPTHPEIVALKSKMYAERAIYAAMSGSGSAIFGIFGR